MSKLKYVIQRIKPYQYFYFRWIIPEDLRGIIVKSQVRIYLKNANYYSRHTTVLWGTYYQNLSKKSSLIPRKIPVVKINMTEFEKIVKIASGQRKLEMRWSRLLGLTKISILLLLIGSFWYSFILLPHRDIDSNYDSSRQKDMKRY